MLTVIETPDRIEIQAVMSAGQRVMLLLLALFSLLVPYYLLIRPEWDSYRNIVFLVFVVISLGAICLSVILAGLALAGTSTQLHLDRFGITHITHAPMLGRWVRRYPLQAITQLTIETLAWSNGLNSYALVLKINDGQSIKLPYSDSQPEVRALRQKMADFIDSVSQP